MYCGRLDVERGVFKFIEDYANFLENEWEEGTEYPVFLGIGGCTNKPGIDLVYEKALNHVKSLPDHLHKYFIIPGIAVPHENVIDIPDLDVSPSNEEGFGIGSKQSQAHGGALVAVSTHSGPDDKPVSGHLETNEFGRPGKADTALGFKTKDPKVVFEAGMHLANPDAFPDKVEHYRQIRHAGFVHAERWGIEPVIHRQMKIIEEKRPGFFMKDGHSNIYLAPQGEFGKE